MGYKRKNRRNRILALLLTACMALTNFPLPVQAEEKAGAAEAAYTLRFVLRRGDRTEEIPGVKVGKIMDGEEEVKPTNGRYPLDPGKQYNYTLTGPYLSEEITGQFESEASDEVMYVALPEENIKVNMNTVDKDIYPGDAITLQPETDWELEWKWESSDEKVATVDGTGTVNAVKSGTVTITKTAADYKNVAASRKVTVNQFVCCKIIYKIDSETQTVAESNELSDEAQMPVIQLDGNEVIRQDNGTYLLKPGAEYTCEVTGLKTKDGMDKATFTAPSYSEGEVPVLVVFESLVEPEFELEGKAISEGQERKFKSGSTIELTCTNRENLFDADGWNYTVTYLSSQNTEPRTLAVAPEEGGAAMKIKVVSDLEELGEESGNGKVDSIKIDCSYGEYQKSLGEYGIFDSYTIKTFYDGKMPEETEDKCYELTNGSNGIQYTIKQGDAEINLENMEAGKTYSIHTDVTGFTENDFTVEAKPDEPEIRLIYHYNELVAPNIFSNSIKVVTGQVGEDITVENIQTRINGCYPYAGEEGMWDWDWKCVNPTSGKKIPIIPQKQDIEGKEEEEDPAAVIESNGLKGYNYKLTIDLKDADAGDYEISYGYKGLRGENKITLKVEAISPYIDKDMLGKESSITKTKIYNGKREIDIEVPLSDSMVQWEGKEDSAYDKNDILLLTGELENANVDTYHRVKITDAKLKNETHQNQYRFDDIKEQIHAEGGLVLEENVNITVTKADVAVTEPAPVVVYFQYRTGKFHTYATKDFLKFEPKESDDSIEMDDIVKEWKAAVKDIKPYFIDTDGNPDTVQLTVVGCDTDTEQYYVDSDNVRFTFGAETYLMDSEGNAVFKAARASEILKDENAGTSEHIQLFQEGDLRFPVKDEENVWKDNCNDKGIKGEFKSGSYYHSADAYDHIEFLECTDRMEEMNDETIIYDGGKSGVTEIDVAEHLQEYNAGRDFYYEILFVPEESKYSTVAGLLHIIPEEQREQVQKKDSINGYPVITLYLDTTPPEVEYRDEEGKASLNRNPKTTFSNIEENREKIGFLVNNSGFAVKSVAYCFKKVEKDMLPKEEPNGEFTPLSEDFSEPETYCELDISQTLGEGKEPGEYDGYYLLGVKAVNEGGKGAVYWTNAFYVDRTEPKIEPAYRGKDGEDLTAQIAGKGESGKFYYGGVVYADYHVEEEHLDSVKAEITAVDLEGRVLELGDDLKEEIEEGIRGESQTASCKFTQSGNYTVRITVRDHVGNTSSITQIFTVDDQRPDVGIIHTEGSSYQTIKKDDGKKKGKITMAVKYLVESWKELTARMLYRVFSQEEVRFTMEGSDEISPVDIWYCVKDKEMSEEDLKNLEKTEWIRYAAEEGKQPVIAVNDKKVVYGKIEDRAGNVLYISTDGIITDNRKPEIILTAEEKPNAKGFYNGDVRLSVEVGEPEGGVEACSGLQYVGYRLEAEDVETKSEVLYDVDGTKGAEGQIKTKLNKDIRIDAETFNRNRVKLVVTAVDQAGNKEEVEKEFRIDNKSPKITVTYDDQPGRAYYNHARTATVTIRERNLDTKDVKLNISSANGHRASVGKWTGSKNAGESDEAEHTCRVVFSEDDDYRITVDCVDMAGNKAEGRFSDAFTVDRTKPVIAVSYNGNTPETNGYYNQAVTATITITEHNFNADKVSVEMFADKLAGKTAPAVSGFDSRGDVHTAAIPYHTDGEYHFRVSYTDEAGNAAESYGSEVFTVDLTEPEIMIANVEDQSANKGGVAPVITCTDANYDREKMSIRVMGANGGEITPEVLKYETEDVAGGQRVQMEFPKQEDMDDLYTLTASVTDKAGNKKEKSIEFSVNRYGSVYTFGTESGQWLTDGEWSYIQEGRPVVIIETNVDEIVEQSISCTTEGMGAVTTKIPEIGNCSEEEREAGTYFEMKEKQGSGQWHQKEYVIGAGNFAKEGRYTIQLDSKDKAGNHTSNVSSRHSGKDLPVQFAVDRTAPSVVVVGTGNREIYNEAKHTVLLDVQDNLAMKEITVYLNGERYGTYDGKALSELEDGMLPVEVGESVAMQRLQVEAVDMAGNRLGMKKEGAYDAEFEELQLLVTRNAFVRFLHTTWMVLLALLLVGGGIFGVVFVAGRKKKKQEEA